MENDARQSKRVAIYRAALTAYSRYGIPNATARQIAEIAGIGKSTIFEYFKSCDELMDEAIAWYIAQSQASWSGLRETAESDAAAALSGYLDSLTRLILSEPDKLLLISQYVTAILASGREFTAVKQEYKEKLQPSADALMSEFKAIVVSGMKSGVFSPVGGSDEQDCSLMLTAIAREMQSQAFVQEEAKIKETCRRLKHMAFRMLGYEKNLR
jgi:AcrR family transcriptional regulator